MSKPASRRVHEAHAYVLHTSPWRETSLILQAFSREHGLVALVAKGAKRPYSNLRPVLVCFQPLILSWSGAADVYTLTKAEPGPPRLLDGRALMSAWYLNELILRLLGREDAHSKVFDAYEQALLSLAGASGSKAATAIHAALRKFEWLILEQSGYGFDYAMPQLDEAGNLAALQQILRARLEQILESPLRTRQVLLELQRY